MAKKPKPEGKKYSYMDTYGDLVTLLLCFFVLLFAMSTVEENKYNAFAEALSNRFGPTPPANLSTVPPNASSVSGDDFGDADPTGDVTMDPDQILPADFNQLHEAITRYVEENGMEGEVTIERGESGAIFIRLSHNLLFGGDSAILSGDAQAFLDFLGNCFNEVENDIFKVKILGHTAAIDGSGVDDRVLSSERAARVSSYLERQTGFNPVLMETVAYGRHFPIGDNNTPEGRAENRRVDMVVVGNDATRLMAALTEASNPYFPDDDTQFFEGPPEELPGTMLDNIGPLDGSVDLSHLSDAQVAELLDLLESM